jgi:hypothetical protein
MGLDPRFLPDRFKERMDEASRKSELKRIGLKAVQTSAEASLKELLRLERQDHSDFSNYLLQKGIEYEHDDPSRRTSNRKGWPDFRLYDGPPASVLFVEFKIRPNKLTPEQEQVRRSLEKRGFTYVVSYSLSGAIEAVNRWREIGT